MHHHSPPKMIIVLQIWESTLSHDVLQPLRACVPKMTLRRGQQNVSKLMLFVIYMCSEQSICTLYSRWWFQIFFIFTPIWGRFPIWLIFFKWVETTNQYFIFRHYEPDNMNCVWIVYLYVSGAFGITLRFTPLHMSHRHAYDMFTFGSRHAVKIVSVSEFAGHICSKW